MLPRAATSYLRPRVAQRHRADHCPGILLVAGASITEAALVVIVHRGSFKPYAGCCIRPIRDVRGQSAQGRTQGLQFTNAVRRFLGLRVRPPTPSWGSTVRTGHQYLATAPWLSLAPGMAKFIAVLGLNLLGDGLRQALDPRLRTSGKDSDEVARSAFFGAGTDPVQRRVDVTGYVGALFDAVQHHRFEHRHHARR